MVYRRSSLPDLTYNDYATDDINSSTVKEEVVEVTKVLEKITTIENLESESHDELVMFGLSSSSSISEIRRENNIISNQLITNSMRCQFCGYFLKSNDLKLNT